MGKKTVFTNITPLPPNVSREVAVAMLHNHDEMIELNPLVIEHHPVKTPRDAPKDEFLDCAWHEMTDRISYLPGGIVKGKVTYKGCFHDLPNGLQTHVYAPMSLDIREKWTVCGALPGEPEEARELGLNTPRRGLYLREDGEMKCNMLVTSFVRKNLDNSHKVLVERILAKAERIQAQINYNNASASETSSIRGGTGNIPPFQPGSHMGSSTFVRQMSGTPTSSPISPPGLRNGQIRNSYDSATTYTGQPQKCIHDHHNTIQELPVSQPGNVEGAIQPQTLKDQDPEELQTVHPALREQYRQNLAQSGSRSNGTGARKPPTTSKSFAAELEGSTPELKSTNTNKTLPRGPGLVEMDGGYTGPLSNGNFSPVTNTGGYSNDTNDYPRDGSVSEMSTLVSNQYQQQYQHQHQRIPNLAHMRSYSQPMIEANTYIDSASSAHNMEAGSNNISAHSAVSGVGGVVMNQGRFRGLSNSAGSGQTMEQTGNMHHVPTKSQSCDTYDRGYYGNSRTEGGLNVNNENFNDRYSMVSEISGMPTPKAGQYAFENGDVDNRYSVVSAMTDEAPTPKMVSGGFVEQQQHQHQQHQRYIDRRGFI